LKKKDYNYTITDSPPLSVIQQPVCIVTSYALIWETCIGEEINHPRGHIILKYAWGLGTMTNNEVDAYALNEGTKWDLLKGILRIIICGDSMIIIRAIIQKKKKKHSREKYIHGSSHMNPGSSLSI
jgi:ribonuclease HI